MKAILLLVGALGARVTEPMAMIASGAVLLSLASALRRSTADSAQ
jgi:hypothetical protein